MSGNDKSAVRYVSLRSRMLSAVLMLIAAAAFCVCGPSEALAASPLRIAGDATELILDYGEEYPSSDGDMRKHSGIDICADAGWAVLAPLSGTVRFVGSVPAGERAGSGTQTALSIDIGNGLVVTLMPLEATRVSEGEQVHEGQVLATLAASGDKSTHRTHLHLGLKRCENGRRDVYLDPGWILGLSRDGAGDADADSLAAAHRQESTQLPMGSLPLDPDSNLALEVSLSEADISAQDATSSAELVTSGETSWELANQLGLDYRRLASAGPQDIGDTALDPMGMLQAFWNEKAGNMVLFLENLGVEGSIAALAPWGLAVGFLFALAAVGRKAYTSFRRFACTSRNRRCYDS